MKIELKGQLDFFPKDHTKKHKSQSSWKKVAIIKTDCDLDRYYAWFLKKRFNLELNSNLRGSHVTFISDIVDASQFEKIAQLFQGKEINFNLDLNPQSNCEHWWLNVDCQEAESIRELMGLPRIPFYKFHLTIGYANDKNLQHSEYIFEQINSFNLMF